MYSVVQSSGQVNRQVCFLLFVTNFLGVVKRFEIVKTRDGKVLFPRNLRTSSRLFWKVFLCRKACKSFLKLEENGSLRIFFKTAV